MAKDDGKWTRALVGVRRDPSGNAQSLEQRAVEDSLARGAPCVAVVDGFDTWFPRADGAHPQWLAVPDAVTARLVSARGFPPENIRVTGNPAFHAVLAEERARIRAAARAHLGLKEGERWIAYVTQPTADVVERLPRVRESLRARDRLVVLLHPRDCRGYDGYNVQRLDNPRHIAGYDVVLFHSSSIGIHALLMGIPAVCVMTPEEWDQFAAVGGYPPVALGLCEWAGDDFSTALAAARPVDEEVLRDALHLDGHATDRIIALLIDGTW